MAEIDDSGPVALGSGWRLRLSPVRMAVLAAALVLAGFAALGSLSALQALTGFAFIGAAAWLAGRAGSARGIAANQPVSPPLADPQLDLTIAGLPHPVIAVARDGRVAAFNTAALALAPALRRGEPASIALRIPDVVDAIRVAGSNRKSRRLEFSERAPAERWWEAYVTPIDGDLLLLSFHDLTPLRRVEEMRADFVANASHELRTPLAALRGFIETLQGPAREDTAARERFLEIMRVQATRMSRLIDDLLSLSRIELNAHIRPDTPVDVVAIVRQVVDALQMLAKDRGLEVSVAAPSESLIVPGNRDELTRLFENLIENALKYGASGKKVEIAVARAEDANETEISVRDFGPGIAAEHLPRLTERFYRVDVAESRTQGGTGLGLALVKHILNRHRGRLNIKSRSGEGATFTVRLPFAPDR
jgi:two-component system, OmpR family, phosphate regulon sensor histidine kinase PhoR